MWGGDRVEAGQVGGGGGGHTRGQKPLASSLAPPLPSPGTCGGHWIRTETSSSRTGGCCTTGEGLWAVRGARRSGPVHQLKGLQTLRLTPQPEVMKVTQG